MKKINKVVISFMLVGLLAAAAWLATLAQSEPVTGEGQTHQVYLPLINMGDSTATAQEEVPAIIEAPVSSEEVITAEVSAEVISEASQVDETASAAAINPTITLNGPMEQFFGIRTNSNHGWITDSCGFVQGTSRPTGCGNSAPYGAWIDGPMNPYRYGGHTYFQIAHSENYRIKVPSHNWGNRTSWTMEGDTLPSARQAQESFYNNRHWLFSVRNVNGTLYGLTHHEWYAPQNLQYVGGKPFLKQDANSRYWITAIGWAKSTTGGTSWQMQPTSSGSRRLVVVAEPSLPDAIRCVYGFAHPSNIVWDAVSRYYYFFASSVHYSGTGECVTSDTAKYVSGVSLFRTRTIEQPTGWSFWNGNGWTLINHNTYQGNGNSGQMPYVFWRKNGAGNSAGDCGHLNALNVRYHTPSRKWIVLGNKWCVPKDGCQGQPQGQAVFSWTSNLASPRDLDLTDPRPILNPSGQCFAGRPYYSFFDVSGSADDNYQNIGNNPLLVMVNAEQDRYYHQFLTLAGF